MSIRRSLGWTALGQIVLFAFQFGSQVVISRMLSPYEVGIAAVGFSIADFVNLMEILGLRNFLIREKALDGAAIHTTFTINAMLACAVAATVFLGSIAGGALYNEPGVQRMLMLIAALPLFSIFELRPSAMLQRSLDFRSIAMIGVAKAGCAAAVTITCARLGYSYMSIGYGALAGAAASAILANIRGRAHVGFSLSLSHWRPVCKFGSHMLAIGGVNNIALKAIDLIIGRMLGLSALGLFSRASALYGVLWTNVYTVFTRVVFASMAEEHRTTGSLRNAYLVTLNMVTALLWPAFAGLAVLAGPAIHLMYGDKWMGAAPVLQMYALAGLGLTALTMTWEVFVVSGRTGQQARLEFLRSGLSVVLTVIGCLIGIQAAAASRVLDALVCFGLYRQPLAEMTQTRLSEVASIYRKNAMMTLLAISPSLVMMIGFHWRSDIPVPYLLTSVTMGALLWVAAARSLNGPVTSELTLLWSKVARVRA